MWSPTPSSHGNHSPSLQHAACSLASMSLCVLLSPACGACSSPSPFPKPLIHPSVLVSGFPAPGKPPWMHQAGSAPVAPGTCIYISTCHTLVDAFLTCLATRLQALWGQGLCLLPLYPKVVWHSSWHLMSQGSFTWDNLYNQFNYLVHKRFEGANVKGKGVLMPATYTFYTFCFPTKAL